MLFSSQQIDTTAGLKAEFKNKPDGQFRPDIFRVSGYEKGAADPALSTTVRRALAIRSLFTEPGAYIYKNDLIAGSIRPMFVVPDDAQNAAAAKYTAEFPERWFANNSDHYAPDYRTAVETGIPGLLQKSADSKQKHQNEPQKVDFLDSMAITLEALLEKFRQYAAKADELLRGLSDGDPAAEGYDKARLEFIKGNCEALTRGAPQTFAQGLQLVWMLHHCFVCEGRYAMALGRIDQYLYPLFRADLNRGQTSCTEAEALLANAFAKICEARFRGGDDVVNICIGGVDTDGALAVNELSYCTLRSVRDVNMPGPNLSARIAPGTPDAFLDECLKVIGTGLGYPALMNDTVNMAALRRYGYAEEDVRDYCMVGCIENFLQGRQPPWSDGRFDPINYLEQLFFEQGDRPCARLDEIADMAEFMKIYEKQLVKAVEDYVNATRAAAFVPDPENQTMPFMSCFCRDCIDRGLDINMGGAKYPSVHGAALMGVGTVSDSLAAIEKLVFEEKVVTLSEFAAALKDNYEHYPELRAKALAAPKYGNNDPFVDKYAVWYTQYISDLFRNYRTNDGGGYYTAMAANVSNIYAGAGLGATPDGRLAGRPLSDAASPTYGCDTRGVTSTLLSVSKPDYSNCACGTVVNQKFTPSAFADGKREKLLKLIRVYFERGGQELQINSTSREVLKDAMEHPENYPTLVVRVSGFSALYITLAREVQEDILSRTQHEEL